MQGKILDYNNDLKRGLIRAVDGNKYQFSIDECKSSIKPRVSAEVDFEINGDKAIEVYVLTKDTVDDIKDAATFAIRATTSAVKGSAPTIKKIIPYVVSIAFVIGLGVIIYDEYQKYQWQQANKELAQDALKQAVKMRSDFEKANLLFKNNQYEEAFSIYVDLFNRDESENKYQFMAVACLIQLNNPIRAKAMLDKVKLSDSYIDNYGEVVRRDADDKDKAKYFFLKAMINKLNNKYKPDGFYDQSNDYYSANAEEACKYGECSLVKK